MMNQEKQLTTNTGMRMPKLIYGTAWNQERTAALVEQAMVLGFLGIDTACQPKHYNEAGVGDGIAVSLRRGFITRSDLYLQSKFTPLNGQDPNRIPYDSTASLGEQVTQSAHASLINLKTDYLDCLLLHSPMPSQLQTRDVWQAMEKLVHTGDIKQLGISNCYDLNALKILFEFANVKPTVVQNRFYVNTGYDKAIRDFCNKNGIIYQSFWTLTANPHILANAKVVNIAEKYHRGIAQVFFRYLTQIGIVPLVGTTSETHMKEDLAIFEFELNAEDCSVIKELL